MKHSITKSVFISSMLFASALFGMTQEETVTQNDRLATARNMLNTLTILPARHGAMDKKKRLEIASLGGYSPDGTFMQILKTALKDRVTYSGFSFRDGGSKTEITVDESIFSALEQKWNDARAVYPTIFAINYDLQMYGRIRDSGPSRWFANLAGGRSLLDNRGSLFAQRNETAPGQYTFMAEVNLSRQPKITLAGEEARVLYMTLAYCYNTGWYKKVDQLPIKIVIEEDGTRELEPSIQSLSDLDKLVHEKYAWQEQ